MFIFIVFLSYARLNGTGREFTCKHFVCCYQTPVMAHFMVIFFNDTNGRNNLLHKFVK
jgi:hypothetical protein